MIKGKTKSSFDVEKFSVEVSVTNEMLENAKVRADKIPSNIKNSIRKGEGRLCGAIGEMALIKISGGEESIGRSVYQYDVNIRGMLCEVKTKERNDIPKSHYNCTVANVNATQKCDYYIFASTNRDYSKVWILGFLPREEFIQKSRFMKKGEYDSENDYTCHEDCWNVRIDELRNIRELI